MNNKNLHWAIVVILSLLFCVLVLIFVKDSPRVKKQVQKSNYKHI